ncbi:MAG: hypothetical protein OEY74_07690, partial [Gammaproteobacteria bacterium]|nr:hypothetical protein [Gammaproteobacteria bacterium]
MQAIAKWLVARPYYAVAGLAVTLLLPAPQLISGAILVLLLLAEGTRRAATRMMVAAAALAAASLLLGGSLMSLVALMVATWVPALVLAQALVT